MDENAIRDIALFFFFCLMDEGKAFEMASRCTDEYQELKLKNPLQKPPVLVIEVTSKAWKKLIPKFQRGHPRLARGMGWKVPQGLNLGPWLEYQKTANPEDLAVSVWSFILKYSDADIARGLHLSSGTIRYRLGQCLKKMGASL